MMFRGDDRAVTVQIGAVLLFGFLVVAMSAYQVTVVPAETEAAEFEHSREVQTDVLDLRSAAHRAAVAGGSHPTTVDLGVTYPRRTFFVNPPPARGYAETVAVGDGTLTVSNATTDAREVADYWNGTARSFDTRTVRYRPSYNQYADAPRTAYGNTVVYNRFANGYVGNRSGQTLVDGRRLSPVLVGGGLSVGGTDARSITPRAVSAASRTVPVRGDGDNVTLTLPTRLSAETWRSLLASEIDGTGDETDDRYVHAVRNVSAEAVEIEMEANATYDLRIAKVGFGSVSEPEPYYVVPVSANASVAEGGRTAVTFEVRDRYDSPVSGARVNVSLAGAVPGDGRETLSVGDASGDRLVGLTTDEEGQVTVEYVAPADVDGAREATVTAELVDPAADASTAARVAAATFDVGSDRSGEYHLEWDLDEIANQEGITNCVAATNTCTYDGSADSNEKVTLPVVSAGASFVDVDFSVNDSAVVGSLSPTTDETGTDGRGLTTAKIDTTGSVSVVASAAADADRLTIRVEATHG